MDYSKKCIGLIPARSGSKRIPLKNIKPLAGHPLIAYTISAALQSKVFDQVVVSTDSPEIAEIAKKYGATVPFLRPVEMAGDKSSDIEWVRHALEFFKQQGKDYGSFSILRPTSPFRQPQTIVRAWQVFLAHPTADSIRAVEKCKQHPAKMWRVVGEFMTPVLENPDKNATPWHSMQYQALPEIYVQNASLEIAKSSAVFSKGSIAGDIITPFFTEGHEGVDVNNPEDWVIAEYLIANKQAQLPTLLTA